MRKSTVVILNQINIKIIKSIKIILKKIITKTNHAGEHCSNPQCFKEKNYETKLSTSSI